MPKANKWFERMNEKTTASRVADLPILMALGPSTQPSKDKPTKTQSGESYHVVGKSVVDEGAVAI